MKTNRTTQKKATVRKPAKKRKPQSLNEFEGNEYTGVRAEEDWALGKGKWTESRRAPKEWDFIFETIALKAFKGHKPMPVGSEHHNYILAHQKLVKTRNNTYTLKLEGIKFKLAHKEDGGATLSANTLAQKNELIRILKKTLQDLEMGNGRAPAETKRTPIRGIN